MVQLKLDTTASAGLRPLGTPGQRSYELIVPTVLKALGKAHADLFAEPVATPSGGSTDWYAPVPGTARRLLDLGPEAQAAMRDRLGTLVGEVSALADRLAVAPDAESQRLAQALRHAVEVPDEMSVFVVGEQPVLVNWAHHHDVKEAPKGLLQAMVPMRAPPPPPPPPAVEPGAADAAVVVPVAVAAARSPLDWLWWLTVAVTGGVIAAALWLLVAPCGLSGPAWLNFCPQPAVQAAVDPGLAARRAQLEAEIAAAERAALAAQRACVPTAPPAPPQRAEAPPAPPPDPPRDEIDERREAAGGQQGELTVTLVWDSRADLDMHITCPGGQTINYTNTRGCGGGELDVDANVSARTTTPVENVFFRTGAQRGTYRIRVNMFDDGGRAGSSHAFTVRVQMGSSQETFRGTVSARQPNWTKSFDYRG